MKTNAWFCHPCLSSCRRIRVNIHSFCQFWIGFASDHPLCIVIFVPPRHAEKEKIKIFAQKFCFFFHFFLKIWNFWKKILNFFRFFYLTSSAAAISMSMQYFAFGFRPFTIVLYAGNMRLKINFSIIVSLEIHIFSKWPKFENFEKNLNLKTCWKTFSNFFKFNFYI